MYSQSNEEQIIKQYFGDSIGTLLDIGANDGVTFSNSRGLIEQGWTAHLVEPSPKAYALLSSLYGDVENVYCHACAIMEDNGIFTLYESGAHVPHGTDVALVSTVNISDTKRWAKVTFDEVEVAGLTFESFKNIQEITHADFISIDAEGNDYCILSQINLSSIGCKCLCIEWNSKPELAKLYVDYCTKYGLREIHRNAENIIYAA